MDASIIPLCISLSDWAKFRTKKAAVQLHAVLDSDSGLPNYAVITDGKKHDVSQAKQLSPTGSVLVVDRAYVDYSWLNVLDRTGVFFATRLKKNGSILIAESCRSYFEFVIWIYSSFCRLQIQNNSETILTPLQICPEHRLFRLGDFVFYK